MMQSVLLIGANRGLGLGLARDYLRRGWRVTATTRDPGKAEALDALGRESGGTLRVEQADITDRVSMERLAAAVAGQAFDLLFIVAGRSGSSAAPVHEVSPESASLEFLTNSYGPPVAAERLLGVLRPKAPVVFMTSVLGSLSRSSGGMEIYSASKAALNMLGIAFARRHPERPVILMHPGWVKTDMGGANAPLDVETSARGMVDAIAAREGAAGVAYIDYKGEAIGW